MAPAESEPFVDYYELLSISAAATESEIRRAYRKTSLLYHPDKVKQTPETIDKFQLLQVAYNILTDAAEKSKYDQIREAKQRRILENAALEGRRRQMKEDLEGREQATKLGGSLNAVNGVKRSWTDRELDVKRIAEENRRKREAIVQERAKQAREAQATEINKEEEEKIPDAMERSVKIQWLKEGDGLDIDDEWLTEACVRYGKVENVLVLKDRKKRINGRERKVVLGTALVVFESLPAAKKAVAGPVVDGIESISWAAEKENEPS